MKQDYMKNSMKKFKKQYASLKETDTFQIKNKKQMFEINK